MLRKLCLIVATALAFTTAPSATAETRVALVIGNSAYSDRSAPALTNPVNDADLVAASLRRANFDVTERKDRNHNEFHEELEHFREKASTADVALIYYAGHGLEANDKNWLIPTDYRARRAADLHYDAIDMEELVRSLAGAKLKVLVLDACRDNPWVQNLREATRSVTIGLASLTPADSIVIYAAAPGTTAEDGRGKANSPFATAFAHEILKSGKEYSLQNLGPRLRDDVLAATDRRQSPFTSLNVTAVPYYLCPEACSVSEVAAVSMRGAAGTSQRGIPAPGQRALDVVSDTASQPEQVPVAPGHVLKICRSFYKAPVATYLASVDWGASPPPQAGKKFVLAVKDTDVEKQSGTPIFWVQASYQSFHGKGNEGIEFNIADGPNYPFVYGVYEMEEMAFKAYRDDCRQNQARCFVTGYGEGPNLLTNTVTLASAQETADCQSLQ